MSAVSNLRLVPQPARSTAGAMAPPEGTTTIEMLARARVASDRLAAIAQAARARLAAIDQEEAAQ